ncbi:GcrA family cell cycle regulator [Bradyrhizobium sp. JR18.2]|uniref:GcrA family cell cycle regulator n=1 Tax=Bradyrhizobium sp. JR18.2 TaxID=3156369 RepID=UPI003397F473
MKNWSEADDEKILHLLSQGRTRRQIAVYFGVTRNAICGRVHRLKPEPHATIEKVGPDDEDHLGEVSHGATEDPRITNRKKIIRSLTSALENSTDEVFRERALWIIETKQSEINCLLAVADCHADS